MATELTTVQSHAPINKPQIEEAPARYSYLDVALGKGDDSCMKTIKIAAAVMTLGATLVLAGVLDLMSHAWSWITGPSAEAHEISVVPTDVEEIEKPEAPAAPTTAVITQVTEEEAEIETPVTVVKEETEVEAPKDDSWRVTRMAKNVANTVKDYSVSAWNNYAVPGFNSSTKFISEHKKETIGAGVIIGATYLGYQYRAEIGGMAQSAWSQAPTWDGTKQTFSDAGTWVKENTWDRMPSWRSTEETPETPKTETPEAQPEAPKVETPEAQPEATEGQ